VGISAPLFLFSTVPGEVKDKNTKGILFLIEERISSGFLFLLQNGILIKTKEGINLKDLLCKQLGLSPEYLDTQIQSILLNGKPVDSPDDATLEEGAVLALSSGMPGLVGATLRKKSLLASFRSNITHKEEKKTKSNKAAKIKLKLFNLVMKDWGPSLLKQGVWLEREALLDFLKERPADFWHGCIEISIMGEKITPERLLEMLRADAEYIFLQVQVAEYDPNPAIKL